MKLLANFVLVDRLSVRRQGAFVTQDKVHRRCFAFNISNLIADGDGAQSVPPNAVLGKYILAAEPIDENAFFVAQFIVDEDGQDFMSTLAAGLRIFVLVLRRGSRPARNAFRCANPRSVVSPHGTSAASERIPGFACRIVGSAQRRSDCSSRQCWDTGTRFGSFVPLWKPQKI